MGITILKCTNCGANIELNEEQEIGFCKYCGTKVIKEQPEVQKIKIDGTIEIKNNEFESKLAIADNLAESFFKEYTSKIAYNQVFEAYFEAESIGANESILYVHMLDFFIKANLIDNKFFYTKNRKMLINKYDKLLSFALKYEKNDEKRKILEKKYTDYREKFLDMFIEKLKKYKQKKLAIIIYYLVLFLYGILKNFNVGIFYTFVFFCSTVLVPIILWTKIVISINK